MAATEAATQESADAVAFMEDDLAALRQELDSEKAGHAELLAVAGEHEARAQSEHEHDARGEHEHEARAADEQEAHDEGEGRDEDEDELWAPGRRELGTCERAGANLRNLNLDFS